MRESQNVHFFFLTILDTENLCILKLRKEK